jgi:predicted secreted protein
MSEKTGNECVLKIGPVGSAAGTVIVPKVRDNELNLKANEIDKTSRADNGWKGKRAGLKEWGASFDMLYDPDDTSWQMLQAAFFGGLTIGCSILDGDEGGEGTHGKVFVTEFTRGEPLDGMVTTKVTLVGDGKPVWE